MQHILNDTMQHISNDIKQNNFRQSYLLFGEERYLRRQYTDKLRQAMCNAEDQMNVHFYTGKDIAIGQIIDQAETLPFLAERRVIFISDSGLFKSGGEKLAEYLQNPCETTFFVFTESEVDKRSKLYNTVQSKGYAAEFTQPDEDTLLRWIGKTLAKENKKISQNTAQFFLEKAGTDMENIQMELEKLICYCGDQEIVTSEAVEAICTTRVTSHIFDMIDAIGNGRTKQALQLYYDLLALKEKPMRIISLIARQCNMLLQVKKLRAQGFEAKTIAPKIGVKPFVAGKYLTQAGRFHSSTLRRAVEQCVEAEEAVKSGRLNEDISVEILILNVLKSKAESM